MENKGNGWKILAIAGFGVLLCCALFLTGLNVFWGRKLVIAQAEQASAKEQETEERERKAGEREREIMGYPLLTELPQGADEDDYVRVFPADETGAVSDSPCYIPRQKDSMGGFGSDACTYDVMAGWSECSAEVDACLDEWVNSGRDGMGVYAHVTEKRVLEEVTEAGGWDTVQTQITTAMQKVNGLDISGLVFERYVLENGQELFYYTFTCDNGTDRTQYAVAYAWGDTYMAEFIGYESILAGLSPQIGEITRYMAASFEDLGGEKVWSHLKYRPYLGYEDWPWEALHNPFAIAQKVEGLYVPEPLEGEDTELVFVSEEWENLIYNVVGYYNDMDQSEWEALCERPLRRSDVAFIREIDLQESPIPGRGTVSFSDGHYVMSLEDNTVANYELTTLQDLAALPCLEKVTLDIGGINDYDALGNCTTLTEVTILSEEFLKNLDWLDSLPNLRSLTLGTSNMGYLYDNGYLAGADTTFADKAMENQKAGKMTVEEALSTCRNLEYLQIRYSGELDYTFLEQMPQLYAFCLYKGSSFGEEELDRSDRFGEDFCPQIQCLVVDDHWLRNPE